MSLIATYFIDSVIFLAKSHFTGFYSFRLSMTPCAIILVNSRITPDLRGVTFKTASVL